MPVLNHATYIAFNKHVLYCNMFIKHASITLKNNTHVCIEQYTFLTSVGWLSVKDFQGKNAYKSLLTKPLLYS